jgi:radical SAM superfamily enzyme YgiQ (UPF0313 family)
MKILFIEPAFDLGCYNDAVYFDGPQYPPYWAITLATYLKNNLSNIDIKIHDCRLNNLNNAEDEIKNYRPDFLCISPTQNSYNNTLLLARIAKKIGANVVFGGHQATGLWKQILINRGINSSDYCVDFIVCEDGEEALLELVKGENLHKISNLCFVDEQNKIQCNKIENIDLETTPHANWKDFISLKQYFNNSQKNLLATSYKRPTMIYSRKGCMWRQKSGGCIFCARMYNLHRIKSPQHTVDEIKRLIDDHKTDFIFDASDDFLDNMEWFNSFYNIYKKIKNKPVLRVYSRVNYLTDDTCRMLKELRVEELIVGFENGDNEVLASMNKGSTVQMNNNALKMTQKNNIKVYATFIIGGVGVDRKRLVHARNYIMNFQKETNIKSIVVHLLKPLPNSRAFEMLMKKLNNTMQDRDFVDSKDLIQLWVKNFCKISFSELLIEHYKLFIDTKSGGLKKVYE